MIKNNKSGEKREVITTVINRKKNWTGNYIRKNFSTKDGIGERQRE